MVGIINQKSSRTEIINKKPQGKLFVKEMFMWDSDNDEYSTTVNTTEWAPEAVR